MTIQEVYKALDLDSAQLTHFGIRGMKWGVRRSRAQLARNHSANLTDSVDAVRARETLTTIRSKGSLSAVSDADLNHLINRLNAEKRFAEANPAGLDKRHSQVKKALAVGGTMNDAIKFVNSPAGKLVFSSVLGKSTGRHAMPVANQIAKLSSGGKKKKK